jgi:hypothetical protein
MNLTLTFYLLILSHFVADFILQGSLAVKKRGLNKYMLGHGTIMALAFFLPLINYPAGKTVVGALLVFVLHILLDAVRAEVNRILKIQPFTYLFNVSLGIDQILHISIIYFIFTYLISR